MHKMMSDYQPPDVGLKLNRTQWKAMFIINGHQGDLTMSELSKIMNLEKGSVTSVVGGLISNNLVRRHQNDEDRRKIFLVMTESSKDVVKKGMEAAIAHTKGKMEKLTESEIETLHNSLKNLLEIGTKL